MSKITHDSPDEDQCMRVRCTGSELSLAECTIHDPEPITKAGVAALTCYEEPKGAVCSEMQSSCLNLLS